MVEKKRRAVGAPSTARLPRRVQAGNDGSEGLTGVGAAGDGAADDQVVGAEGEPLGRGDDPALVTGGSQAFIRSLGEFGAVIMIAGNIPYKTEVSSLMIFVRLQEFNYPAAAAIASVILLASLTLLFILQVVQGRLFAWQRQGR